MAQTERDANDKSTVIETKVFDVRQNWQKKKNGWQWIASRESWRPDEKARTK